MTFRFVETQNAVYPIIVLCRVLEVSRPGYYAWRKRRACPSARRQRDPVLQAALRKLHADGRGVYGSPRLTVAARTAGIAIGRHAIARLMRLEGLVGRCWSRRPRATSPPASVAVAPNRLMRSFTQLTPNRVWVTDITYLPVKHGTLYLAVVLDLYARRVVGHAIADHMRTDLPLAALDMALGRRGPVPGLLHHSDQGSQYTSHLYQNELKKHGLIPSMSRRAQCWDNAVVESFFGSLKSELDLPSRHQTPEQVTANVFDYIEVFYNRQRLHSFNGYRTPAQAEAEAVY
jgi:putative transposase